jgi:hypothetical protein
MLTSCRSVIWHNVTPLKFVVQLSIEMTDTPASTRAPRRFSSSSSLAALEIAGALRPCAIVEIKSVR